MVSSAASKTDMKALRAAIAFATHGQSLVEFVLVTPILVLILLGAFSFGLGTYQAHMTSDAVQLPMLKTMEMANTPGPVSPGMLQGYITGGGLKGSLVQGNLVDSLKVSDERILVASKAYLPLVSFVPGFTISVGQALNPSLLKPTASGGAPARAANTPWVPGGAMQPPPWTPEGAMPPVAPPIAP